MKIEITRNPSPQTPPTKDFGFGQIFTPHMFRLDWKDGAWRDPRIVPYGPFAIDPAAKVLHYGQEIFEGMKAYKNSQDQTVHMFRPDKNIRRFNISCERMCMPPVDGQLFMEALELLIDMDRSWVPESPNAAMRKRQSPCTGIWICGVVLLAMSAVIGIGARFFVFNRVFYILG